MAQKLQQQQLLKEVGSKLETPPASKDSLLKLLKQAANCLAEIDQSPLPTVLDSMQPCLNALAKQELLKHQDRDVKVLVATCICEITRITAPEAPYSDDVLRDIFHLIVGTFTGLGDINNPSFGRRVVILETLARYRSCLVMLDLECHDLIHEMFSTFFSVVSDDHPQNVLTSMQTIMILILEESEEIQENLLSTILCALGRKSDLSMAARKLAMNIITHSARKLEPCIKQLLVSSLSGDDSYLHNSVDYHEVIYDIYRCAPEVLTGIVPYITGELLGWLICVQKKSFALMGNQISQALWLYRTFTCVHADRSRMLMEYACSLFDNYYFYENVSSKNLASGDYIIHHLKTKTDKLDIRRKAVQLLGDLFALPGVSISESFQPLFLEFLKRLTDRVVEIRVSVIEHLKNCLISDPSRPEASQIIKSLSDRLLDYDENVRKQVVSAVYDVACHSLRVIPAYIVNLVAERLRDKSLSVKSYTLDKLAELYRLYCLNSSEDLTTTDEYQWIPGKILRCLYDRDFRSETIELILSKSLVPPEFSVKDKVKHWVTIFSGFDKVEVKALEQILAQKQRLQQEMQKYMSLRQANQEDATEQQKKIFGCFKTMSRLFNDPLKVEENFQFLNQLKDANIWKILTSLLDPSTSLCQAWTLRDDLLKILGEKHPLYHFMGLLSLKCSYLLFNKEYTKEILSQVAAQFSIGNMNLIRSCMGLLTVIACHSPLLLVAHEEDLITLLKEDNEVIKEGITHVLAKAGGNIREQLAMASSSVELLLERLCLEGTRKQAKYAVQALAAVSKDDGLKSLSVLYKRLVDILDEKTHLPAILQSLGCIAQTAMPIFETREEEITSFIMSKILERNNDDEVSVSKTEWSEMSELCSLKIFGIKTMVKSYLPAKDAHLRPGLEKLLETLKNILSFGDISQNIKSSAVDKAHLRLASAKAVLRLSRHWDQKISADIFYMTLRISEDAYPQSRKLFLSKVHQYIKERLLDAKYACAFLFNINDGHSPEYEECKRNLLEIVQICQQVKTRQLSMQCDVISAAAYPEYLLSYVIHAIVHHPSCPDINECTDVKAFEPTYWRLYLLLSLLLQGDEGLQPGNFPNKRKESYTAVLSIFHSIKCSEDAVDGAKSNTLHALCELGISVAKRIMHDQTDISGIQTVSLPSLLYKPVDISKEENFVDHQQIWLSGESALAHFESIRLQSKEKTGLAATEDGMILEDSDVEGNEVPLGKMMEILKSQGAKKKNKKKSGKKNVPSNLEKFENEDDILGVVREINLDSFERDESGISKLTKDQAADDTEHTTITNNNEKELGASKRKREESSVEALVRSPKRKRSISVQRSRSIKGERENKKVLSPYSIVTDETRASSGKKSFEEKDIMKSINSDLLVAFSPTTIGISSRNGNKDADELHDENTATTDSKKSVILEYSKKRANQLKGLTSLTKKQKIKSISGLEKCSSGSLHLSDAELVDSRIKVWWPLDKQFYEGIVQSYDSAKKRHTILYDDGDLEVLNLAKEKWELIDMRHKPKKQEKPQHQSPHKELQMQTVDSKSNHSASRKNKQTTVKPSSSKVGRKISTKKDAESNRNKKTEDDIDANLSDTETTDGSKENGALPVQERLDKPKLKPKESHDEGNSDDELLITCKLRAGKAT